MWRQLCQSRFVCYRRSGALQTFRKYLYNLVKEQTGKSFGEYLEGIRFRQAEKLLIESDTKINRIHKMIGFYSQNTFYKAFYRIYGVSPGTWREHNKQSIKT